MENFDWRPELRRGLAIPAHPLALNAARRLDERGLLAFGDTFTAFVAGGKRPRYGKLLGEEDRVMHNRTRVACAGGAFVMWARGALHCSHDGLGWSAVAGPSSLNLRSLVPSAAGVLAVSSDADVFVFVP